SSDNTPAIVSTASQLYANIQFITEPDGGIYDAMNKGIRKAKGKWLFFLGGDDHFTKKTILSEIGNAIEKNPDADLIYGDVWSEIYHRVYEGEFNINKILGQNVCHQCMFFRKDLFLKMGLYDLKYKHNADYQFNLMCWLSGRIVHRYI